MSFVTCWVFSQLNVLFFYYHNILSPNKFIIIFIFYHTFIQSQFLINMFSIQKVFHQKSLFQKRFHHTFFCHHNFSPNFFSSWFFSSSITFTTVTTVTASTTVTSVTTDIIWYSWNILHKGIRGTNWQTSRLLELLGADKRQTCTNTRYQVSLLEFWASQVVFVNKFNLM